MTGGGRREDVKCDPTRSESTEFPMFNQCSTLWRPGLSTTVQRQVRHVSVTGLGAHTAIYFLRILIRATKKLQGLVDEYNTNIVSMK